MKISRRMLTRAVVVGLMMLLVLILAVAASANGPPPPTGSAHISGCSVYYDVTNLAPDGNQFIELWSHNGENWSFIGQDYYPYPGPGPWNETGKFWVGSKHNGESLELWHWDSSWTLLDTFKFSCIPGAEIPDWYFSVEDLGSTAGYSDGGVQPCGVFDVQGWGAKTVDLTAYPACTGEVTVMCLNSEGNWTDANVSNLTQDGTVVQWTSSQDGTCAFFEK